MREKVYRAFLQGKEGTKRIGIYEKNREECRDSYTNRENTYKAGDIPPIMDLEQRILVGAADFTATYGARDYGLAYLDAHGQLRQLLNSKEKYPVICPSLADADPKTMANYRTGRTVPNSVRGIRTIQRYLQFPITLATGMPLITLYNIIQLSGFMDGNYCPRLHIPGRARHRLMEKIHPFALRSEKRQQDVYRIHPGNTTGRLVSRIPGGIHYQLFLHRTRIPEADAILSSYVEDILLLRSQVYLKNGRLQYVKIRTKYHKEDDWAETKAILDFFLGQRLSVSVSRRMQQKTGEMLVAAEVYIGRSAIPDIRERGAGRIPFPLGS